MESLDTAWPYLVHYSYLGVFALVVAFSVIPLSKTLVIVAAGMLAAEGAGSVWVYLLVSLLALNTADSLYYLLGRLGGAQATHWRLFRGATSARRMQLAAERFRHNDWMAVFAARFLPFIRSFIFLVAGLNRMSLTRFFSADLASAALFAPAAVGLGYFLGKNRERLVQGVETGEWVVGLVIAVILMVVVLRRRGRGQDG